MPSKGISNVPTDDPHVDSLVRDIGEMIETARHQVAVAANVSLTTLYWHVGHRVRTEVLDKRRAEYSARIVGELGRQSETRYGRGFGEKSLRHMIRPSSDTALKTARLPPSSFRWRANAASLEWQPFSSLECCQNA
jgi:hypothetical protein